MRMRAELPANEVERLQTVLNLRILDTEAEVSYDAITSLAAHIMDVPIAAITVIDKNRQWFKSKIGLTDSETTRDVAFCAHAILDPFEPTIVQDATKDKRFADNPDVLKKKGIRFYFGVPLLASNNLPIGTLCAVDTIVRPRPTPGQIESLKNLSRLATSHLELRKFILDVSDEVEKLNHQEDTRTVYEALDNKCDDILAKIKVRKMRAVSDRQ